MPNPETSRNCATMMACTGIIIVDSASRNTAVRPRNLSRANAYPASRLTMTVSTVTKAPITAEFPNQPITGNRSNTFAKFSSVNVLGHSMRPGWNTSPRGEKATTSIQ